MPRLLGQHDSTLEVRGMIISMWEAGVPKHEIPERVDLSVRQINRWIRRHQESAEKGRPLMNKPRTGRRYILNENQKEAAIQWTAEEPFTTATTIRDQLELSCSTDTVILILHKNGIYSRIPARKPDLTEAHANQRLRFAQNHINGIGRL
ncbi:hypothetical protein ILUMI_01205 [Ignelater luminosus]|uniref:Transposase Tc1-like domain-containing protein n=1 Tax=Ignelater luminosus TaxID=2038154 RepID=A0A8K0GKG9_IGNLU|nr:hypothetical protein ILUMI_01205 [Ignelater luminosus]